MSHTPSLPESAQSPYPLRGDQEAERDEAKRALAAKASSDLASEAEQAGPTSRWPRYAAGAAIGSAAVAAALLYYNRKGTD